MSKREPTIEERRADVVRRLIAPGTKRIELIADLAEVEAIVRPLVIEAVELGLTTRRIGDLVGLTSAGVSKWVSKARQAK